MPIFDISQAEKPRQKRSYVRRAEAALGRSIPKGALVHHVNADRTDNRNCNLVILQSDADHREIHRRMRIRQAGGNPWTQQICTRCQTVKDLLAFPPSKRRHGSECSRCAADRTMAAYNAQMGKPNRPATAEERSEQGRKAAAARWRRAS